MEIFTIYEACEYARLFLTEAGYSPEYKYGREQLDCVINDVSFAIFGEEESPTFGIGCIFEHKEALSDEECDKIKAVFDSEESPFEYLHLLDDSIAIESEFEFSVFSSELMTDIVETLTRKEGLIDLLKSFS